MREKVETIRTMRPTRYKLSRKLAAWLVIASVTLHPAYATTLKPASFKCGQPRVVSQDELPEGVDNWGFSSDGLFLSATLEKEEFQVGEPVILHFVLKNVSTVHRGADFSIVGSERADLELTVVERGNKPVLAVPVVKGMTVKSFSSPCRIGSAVVDTLDLNLFFQLELNRTYFVTVAKRVFTPDEKGYQKIVSGTGMFRLVSPPEATAETFNSGSTLTSQPLGAAARTRVTSSANRAINISSTKPATVASRPDSASGPTAAGANNSQTLRYATPPSKPASPVASEASVAVVDPGFATRLGWFGAICLVLGGFLGFILLRAARRRQ